MRPCIYREPASPIGTAWPGLPLERNYEAAESHAR